MTLLRKRFHSVGALGSGTLYCKFYDRPSTENYTGILTNVYGEYGRSVTFVDSAPCHKSEALGRFLERMDGRIRIYQPYTPEANPMEMQGRSFRKTAESILYESVEEMQESINAMRREEEVPVVKTYNRLAR